MSDGYLFSERKWLVGKDTMQQLDKAHKLIRNNDKLYRKLYIDEYKGDIPDTLWDDTSNAANAADEIKKIFGFQAFDTVKPIPYIQRMITLATDTDDIILDFFSGSSTTAHAVFTHNAHIGNGTCRFIMVQLPEALNSKKDTNSYRFCIKNNCPPTIAEISKERIRRAAKKIQEEYPNYEGDLGFKVFKLDSSNIRAWQPNPDNLEGALLAHTDHLVAGRSEQDILYELLLKRGVDLSVPIEAQTIAGKTVYSIGYGVLFACLDQHIGQDDIEALAMGIITWREALNPEGATQVVFRDSAFTNDIAKTNITAMLEQNGIAHVRSL